MDVAHLTERNLDAVVGQVSSLLRRGGVAALPTDTVYGLAADVLNEAAVKKVFRIKARSHQKALPVFVRDIPMARRYAVIDARLWRLLDELWPGQATVVLRKRSAMPDSVSGGMRGVGLRVSEHPFLTALLNFYPNPLTATSANPSGSEPASSGAEVAATFRRHIPTPDLLVDAGALPPSPPSTVLDLTNPQNPRILRMGAITKEQLDTILSQWRIGSREGPDTISGK